MRETEKDGPTRAARTLKDALDAAHAHANGNGHARAHDPAADVPAPPPRPPDEAPAGRPGTAALARAKALLDGAFHRAAAVVELDPKQARGFSVRPFPAPAPALRARYDREAAGLVADLDAVAAAVLAHLRAEQGADDAAPARPPADAGRARPGATLEVRQALAKDLRALAAAGPDAPDAEGRVDAVSGRLAAFLHARAEWQTSWLHRSTWLVASRALPADVATNALDAAARFRGESRFYDYHAATKGAVKDASTARAAPKPVRRAVMECFADVVERKVDWLWPGRVPRGCPTIFSGDPKLGKSFVSIWLAAQVSRGLVPGTTRRTPPGSVVILSAEDSSATTILPRLRSAGADLRRVHRLRSVVLDDGSQAMPSLRTDMATIEAECTAIGDVKLVLLDPVSAYFGGIDEHRGGEVRGLMSPLADLAERLDVAFVLINHLTKSNSTNAKYRMGGSIAFLAAARMSFLFVRDRKAEDRKRVLMLSAGGNIADDPPAIAFQLAPGDPLPVVRWDAKAVAVTAEEALAEAAGDESIGREDRETLDGMLRAILARGPAHAKDIHQLLAEYGYSRDQLKRAKARLGIKHYRRGFGLESYILWARPDVPRAPE
jgi:hypothetical protein